ncbi:hypothetical protein TNCV_335761 [Trichonephila clavipes]|nr:hypothetical protein TNCV_335761 [Trichonephila clavipes]
MSAESPIAHRTRGAGSYEDAAINCMCKICSTRLTSMDDLWIHLRDNHQNDPAKRAKAMEAFPIAFQLDRIADCLPSDALRSTPTVRNSPVPCSPHGSPIILESTRIDGCTDYCSILIEEDPMDPPPGELPGRAPDGEEEVVHKMDAASSMEDYDVARRLKSPLSMGHHHSEALTVDRLVSPLPLDLNVAMSKSVSFLIEDEGEPLPPCTMILQNDPLNRSMPRLLEIGSLGVIDSQARIENTTEIVHMPSTPVSIKDAQVQSPAGPSSSPKNDCGPSPPREQSSPSVLDIILNDDVSIQIETDDVVIEMEPELVELSREWKDRITGSPNKPAFPPLHMPSESCPGKGKSPGVQEQNPSNSDHVAKVVPKGKKDKTRKGGNLAPVKPVYCKHCKRKIFLFSTLENHYMKKHFRRLSPQSSPSVNDEPVPQKQTEASGPPIAIPSTSKGGVPQGDPPPKKTTPTNDRSEDTRAPHRTARLQPA